MVDLLNNEYGFVYAIKSLDLIKVGVAKTIERRLEAMRLMNPHGCELIFYRRTYAPYAFERRMHELLADKAIGREWFRVTLAEVRVASKTARLASIRAERAIRASERTFKNLAQSKTQRSATINDINSLKPNTPPI